ncbi:hypothetical protein B5F74_02260 [Collinsella sp. An271]|uniref:hypothetical protein n=1 Tax=Collinsella sp. An271 TaxID=1965616 RepID=UPI000B36C7C4|nr:hypothetical protein [Collinsella sp. An271]OUO62055.1 hypothetical protein B5F74_02260 [Collinsella sp. An271]
MTKEQASGAEGPEQQEDNQQQQTNTEQAQAAPDAEAVYKAALAERDAKIAELERGIAEAAKTAESAEKLRAEMDELRRAGDEERVGFELALAGARNVKAARALLADHDGDIAALKAAEPWLFESGPAGAPPAPTGKTGLPAAGAATDEGALLKRWREIAGLDDEGKE